MKIFECNFKNPNLRAFFKERGQNKRILAYMENCGI